MSFFNNKRILVTGGTGFLGSYVVEKLKERGCKNIFIPRSKDYDLVQMEISQLLPPKGGSLYVHPLKQDFTRIF